jgi:GNAT superfamily N-acetyltransferase
MKTVLDNGFELIQPSSQDEIEKYRLLRWEILRAPWNQPMTVDPDDGKSNVYPVLILDSNKEAVACGRIIFMEDHSAQIRSIAVSELYRGKGYGKVVMAALEDEAKNRGVTRLFLHARENAIPFYLSLDYEILEKTHLLFNEIQHFSMEKYL